MSFVLDNADRLVFQPVAVDNVTEEVAVNMGNLSYPKSGPWAVSTVQLHAQCSGTWFPCPVWSYVDVDTLVPADTSVFMVASGDDEIDNSTQVVYPFQFTIYFDPDTAHVPGEYRGRLRLFAANQTRDIQLRAFVSDLTSNGSVAVSPSELNLGHFVDTPRCGGINISNTFATTISCALSTSAEVIAFGLDNTSITADIDVPANGQQAVDVCALAGGFGQVTEAVYIECPDADGAAFEVPVLVSYPAFGRCLLDDMCSVND